MLIQNQILFIELQRYKFYMSHIFFFRMLSESGITDLEVATFKVFSAMNIL